MLEFSSPMKVARQGQRASPTVVLHQSFPSPRKVASQGLRVLPTHETQLSPAGGQPRISEPRGIIIMTIITIIIIIIIIIVIIIITSTTIIIIFIIIVMFDDISHRAEILVYLVSAVRTDVNQKICYYIKIPK